MPVFHPRLDVLPAEQKALWPELRPVLENPKDTPVKLSFFGALSFGRVGMPVSSDDGVIEIASLVDLLGHKLKVMLQRIESKDYLDVAAILDARVSLEQGLSAAQVLFGTAFQPSESLKALVYFEGGDLATLPVATREKLISASSRVRELPPIHVISRSLSGPRK